MWNEPTKERLAKIPKLYETEHVPLKDKVVHLHFFFGGCDWYIVEKEKDIMFGYAILNNDYWNAEWGYISLSELRDVQVAGIEIDCEHEQYFPPRPAKEVPKICKGMNWEPPTRNTEKGGKDEKRNPRRTDAASTF